MWCHRRVLARNLRGHVPGPSRRGGCALPPCGKARSPCRAAGPPSRQGAIEGPESQRCRRRPAARGQEPREGIKRAIMTHYGGECICPNEPEACAQHRMIVILVFNGPQDRHRSAVRSQERRCVVASERIRRAVDDSLCEEAPVNEQQNCGAHSTYVGM